MVFELFCHFQEVLILILCHFLQIFGNSIFRLLDNPSDSINLITDKDVLVAYRMLKEEEDYPLIEFIHCDKKK